MKSKQLTELTEIERAVFNLNQRGYRQREIGKLLGRSKNCIMWTLKRCRRKGFIPKDFRIKLPLPPTSHLPDRDEYVRQRTEEMDKQRLEKSGLVYDAQGRRIKPHIINRVN
jgi:IS30 family transposase